MAKMPHWKTPKNMAEVLDEEDVYWEDERWSPILVTAQSGTEYEGREIPVSWQIEFEPGDVDSESASEKMESLGLDADGYGWGALIRTEIEKADAELAKRMHLDDCEASTCVIWVESEDDCHKLTETFWKLVFEG
jgi:hypothetical protein